MKTEPGMDRQLNDSAMLHLLNEDFDNIKDGVKPNDNSMSSINMSSLDTQGHTKDKNQITTNPTDNDQSMHLVDQVKMLNDKSSLTIGSVGEPLDGQP